ncbi:hypothetical protein [Streptomyces marincola]|uniref:Uncharacterized protein n=1 Tax=Streptomyces marincola TaxID=2878388 RepID=A0A1W7CUL1_9ACTN|nr:hypothetical protein [Streptomyces marincola]ARQ68468.1 hypothetical protein CAG99_06015 [Streptomyces marincola]
MPSPIAAAGEPSLRAAVGGVVPPRTPEPPDPATVSYYRDLVEPFGVPVDEDLLRDAPHRTHTELVDRLVEAADIRESRPDLVIVTHALPDVTPFTAIAPYLNRRLGGRATSFGIHQQGLASPFTALRIISAFQRAGRSRRAVLAVLEQTTLPSRFPLVHDTPLVDSGVLLVLGTEGGGPRLADVTTVPAGESAADRLARLAAAAPGRTLVVLGPWARTGPLAPDLPTHRVGAGTYATSVWLAVARRWRAWRCDHAAVVLCDTDPRSGETHLAVLRFDEGPTPPGAGPGTGRSAA